MVQANWEATGLRQYSSRDPELLGSLIQDTAWSNEGLFALLQGLRRLAETGGRRVNLPTIEPGVRECRIPGARGTHTKTPPKPAAGSSATSSTRPKASGRHRPSKSNGAYTRQATNAQNGPQTTSAPPWCSSSRATSPSTSPKAPPH